MSYSNKLHSQCQFQCVFYAATLLWAPNSNDYEGVYHETVHYSRAKQTLFS